jgi:hypothetical protein
MTHRSGPLFKTPLRLTCLLVLALASPASAGWTEKVLYSFQGLPDGSVPAGGVVFDKHGNLYGATTDGGSKSCLGIAQCGTVYQLAPPTQKGGSWSETVLYVFQGKNFNDGETPAGSVIIDQVGNLYGTTGYGGAGTCILLGTNVGCGAVYELSPPAQKGGSWIETILYSFKGSKDGYLPIGDLVFDGARSIYGATEFGGGKGTTCDPYYQYCGTVFKLSPPKQKGGKWTEKVLHSFGGAKDGANPNGGLVLDSKGAVYGMTNIGGDPECPLSKKVGCGVAYKLAPPTKQGGTWTEKLIHTFKNGNDGTQPSGGVIFAKGGSLYGAANGGARSGGVVFQLTQKNQQWKETILHAFSTTTYEYGPLVSLVDKQGVIYGTTNSDPANHLPGTVFRLNPNQSEESLHSFDILYSFKGVPDGAFPTSLVRDGAGNLYGATQAGGAGSGCSFTGCGTVFEVSR